jgi:hypothetical protein
MRTGRVLAAAGFVLLAAVACGSQDSAAGTGGGSGTLTTASVPATLPTKIGTPSGPMSPPTGIITGQPVPPPGTGSGRPTIIPVPNGPRSPVPPGQISSGGMTNPPQGVQVTSDGRYLVFNAEQSGCQQITAQAAAQTAAMVTVQVVTTNTSKGNQVCPMIVRNVQVVAQLNAPLKARKIVFQGVTKHG